MQYKAIKNIPGAWCPKMHKTQHEGEVGTPHHVQKNYAAKTTTCISVTSDLPPAVWKNYLVFLTGQQVLPISIQNK